MMKELYFIGSLPWWLIALVALATIALLLQQFLSLKQRLSLAQSAFLVAIRAVVYGVLIFFLLGPSLIDKRAGKLRRPLTVLIDSSESMDFSAGGSAGKSRLDNVREKLTAGKEPLIQRLSRDYDLRLFRFGTDLEPIDAASVAQLKAQAQGTRLLELVQSAAKDAGAQSAILLFSDGIANGDKKTLEGAPPLPVPVFTVAAAETGGVDPLPPRP